MNYQGNLKQDCEAAQDNLSAKIKLAILYAALDDCFYETEPDPENTDIQFTVGGEDQFFNHLISICTAGEKRDLLLEWVLGDGDTAICAEVCDYLTGKHNGLDAIAKAAANKIINHSNYFDVVQDALARANLPY